MLQGILYEDEHILIVQKKAGIPVQSARHSVIDLESMVKNYLVGEALKSSAQPFVGVVHRLDQPVEGVIVFAKNKQASAKLCKQIAEGQMKKTYLAVSTGRARAAHKHLEQYMLKDGRTNTSKVVSESMKGAKVAVLDYHVLGESEGLTLLEIALQTGRHHQIRVQLAHDDLPIYGDTKYNKAFQSISGWHKLALCAWKQELFHPFTEERMIFRARPEHEIFKSFKLPYIYAEGKVWDRTDD